MTRYTVYEYTGDKNSEETVGKVNSIADVSDSDGLPEISNGDSNGDRTAHIYPEENLAIISTEDKGMIRKIDDIRVPVPKRRHVYQFFRGVDRIHEFRIIPPNGSIVDTTSSNGFNTKNVLTNGSYPIHEVVFEYQGSKFAFTVSSGHTFETQVSSDRAIPVAREYWATINS